MNDLKKQLDSARKEVDKATMALNSAKANLRELEEHTRYRTYF